MKIAIITGASSGMGKEFAFQLDKLLKTTQEIWLIARNEDKLFELSRQLQMKTRRIALDLTKSEDLEAFSEVLRIAQPQIRFLINCAGLGYMGEFLEMDDGKDEEMIACNCIGLTRMTRMCLPYMVRNARIIQLASGAAFLPQPEFAVYAASKAYVLSLSTALSEELRERGVYVTSICPGPVDTPFLDKAKGAGAETKGYKKLVTAKPEEVVRKALKDSYLHKRKSIYGFWMKGLYVLTQIFPEDLFLKMMRIMK